MFPYSGRPTEEFLREYRSKLNELQELMESQGLKLQIKDGGRCIVLPEVKSGMGKVSGKSKDDGDGISNVSKYYASTHEHKVVDDSKNIIDLIKKPNKFSAMIVAIVLVIILLIVLLILLIFKIVHKIKNKNR